MVEGNVTFDLLPNVDLKAFTAWAQKAWAATAKAPGFIEGRAQRGIIAAAQGRSVGVWKSMADWTNFMETTWLPLEAELRNFATNIQDSCWGPSPISPEPIPPSK